MMMKKKKQEKKQEKSGKMRNKMDTVYGVPVSVNPVHFN